jgi:hypothetical protein
MTHPKVQRFIKITLMCVGLLSFIFTLILFGQLQHLKKSLNNANAEISTLNSNTSAINNTLSTIQAATGSLKQTQATAANLALIELEHNLLQGMNKSILLSNLNNLQTLTTNLHSNDINTNLNQLNQSISALPDINPNNAITTLNTLKASIATLSFVNSIPNATPENTTPTQHGFNALLQSLWQKFKSLIIVRTDNTIGTQLVSDAARFDAIRTLNLLIQEAQWQILSLQDPSAMLTQLQIATSAYTEANQAQAAWLAQLTQLQTGNNYYTNAEITPVLQKINNLQQAISLQ